MRGSLLDVSTGQRLVTLNNIEDQCSYSMSGRISNPDVSGGVNRVDLETAMVNRKIFFYSSRVVIIYDGAGGKGGCKTCAQAVGGGQIIDWYPVQTSVYRVRGQKCNL